MRKHFYERLCNALPSPLVGILGSCASLEALPTSAHRARSQKNTSVKPSPIEKGWIFSQILSILLDSKHPAFYDEPYVILVVNRSINNGPGPVSLIWKPHCSRSTPFLGGFYFVSSLFTCPCSWSPHRPSLSPSFRPLDRTNLVVCWPSTSTNTPCVLSRDRPSVVPLFLSTRPAFASHHRFHTRSLFLVLHQQIYSSFVARGCSAANGLDPFSIRFCRC